MQKLTMQAMLCLSSYSILSFLSIFHLIPSQLERKENPDGQVRGKNIRERRIGLMNEQQGGVACHYRCIQRHVDQATDNSDRVQDITVLPTIK